jgi:hypothetical protein
MSRASKSAQRLLRRVVFALALLALACICVFGAIAVIEGGMLLRSIR